MDIFTAGCYAFSIFNLLLLTLILWARKGYGHGNMIFGFYILLFSIPLFLNLAIITNLIQLPYYFLCMFPVLLLGPTAYTFCLMFLQTPLPRKRILLLHYLPAIAGAIILSLLIIAIHKKWLDEQFFLLKGHGIPDFFRYILVIHACSYHFYCWHISEKRLKNYPGNSVVIKKQLSWIHDFFRNMMIVGVLFLFFHSIRFLILGYTQVGSSVISPLVISLSYIMILYKSLSHTPIFTEIRTDDTEEKRKSTGEKKLGFNIDEKQQILIEQKLQEALQKEKLFTNQELNLNTLSVYLKLQPKLVSQFINQRYNSHFNDFINTYRVEESQKLMQDPSMRNLKLEAIAQASGFSSRASFFSIFKKVTGSTPAMFRKEHMNNSAL